MAVRLAIPIAAMWAFLWYVLPEKAGDQSVQAEARALAALREVATALDEYLQARGSYPASLEPLGEKARKPAQSAQSVGYRLEYLPGPAGQGTGAKTFSLVVRAGNYGYRSFFVDQTGAVRATRDNRSATGDDPPI